MNLHGKKEHIILQEEDKNVSKCDTTSQYIFLIIDQHRNQVIHVISSQILNFNNSEDSVFWDIMLCHWVNDFPCCFKVSGKH